MYSNKEKEDELRRIRMEDAEEENDISGIDKCV